MIILPRDDGSTDPPFKITHPPPARDQRHDIVTSTEDPPFNISHPPPARDQHHDLVTRNGLAPGAIAAIVIVVVLVCSIIAWVAYTFLRARRLGLPTPTWRTFVPNRRTQSNSSAFEPTRPAAGGFMARIFPKRNAGYNGHSARMQRLKEDQQVWNADMRDREDTEYHGALANQERERLHGGETMKRGYSDDAGHEDRGRSRSREPPAAGGVRGAKQQGEERPRESIESRRSVFTERI